MTKEQFEQQAIGLTNMMYRVSSSILPQQCDQHDAMQGCLLKAWQHREGLRNESSFRPWLMRILVNECYRIIRKNRNLVYAEVPEMAGEVPQSGLKEAIQALPEKLRLPIVLHYIEGMNVEETARILRIPVGTVKTRLRRARALLKEQIGEEV